jgi:periplasmic protein TonB
MAALGVRWLSRGAACVVVAALVWAALRTPTALFTPEAPVSAALAYAELETPPPRAPPQPRRPPPVPAAIAESAVATPEPPPRVEIANPRWRQRPRHPERNYPAEALASGVEGAVELDCEVSVEGRLACAIVSETPTGWGFGEAALALADEHLMAPVLYNGGPARGHLRMRIPFTQGPRQ